MPTLDTAATVSPPVSDELLALYKAHSAAAEHYKNSVLEMFDSEAFQKILSEAQITVPAQASNAQKTDIAEYLLGIVNGYDHMDGRALGIDGHHTLSQLKDSVLADSDIGLMRPNIETAYLAEHDAYKTLEPLEEAWRSANPDHSFHTAVRDALQNQIPGGTQATTIEHAVIARYETARNAWQPNHDIIATKLDNGLKPVRKGPLGRGKPSEGLLQALIPAELKGANPGLQRNVLMAALFDGYGGEDLAEAVANRVGAAGKTYEDLLGEIRIHPQFGLINNAEAATLKGIHQQYQAALGAAEQTATAAGTTLQQHLASLQPKPVVKPQAPKGGLGQLLRETFTAEGKLEKGARVAGEQTKAAERALAITERTKGFADETARLTGLQAVSAEGIAQAAADAAIHANEISTAATERANAAADHLKSLKAATNKNAKAIKDAEEALKIANEAALKEQIAAQRAAENARKHALNLAREQSNTRLTAAREQSNQKIGEARVAAAEQNSLEKIASREAKALGKLGGTIEATATKSHNAAAVFLGVGAVGALGFAGKALIESMDRSSQQGFDRTA